jgi:hypothetical protein
MLSKGERLSVARNVSGIKNNGVTGGWRILHIAEFLDTNVLPNNVRSIRLRGLSSVGHEELIGVKKVPVGL